MPMLHFNNTRHADLPLHYGRVPSWLADRMSLLGGAILEAIILDYGKSSVLSRLSDPKWFQAFGAVLGMDWHSSGITTSVMGALKKAMNPKFNDLGIYICGGKGKYSTQTPAELIALAARTGLDGDALVHSSKLSAKVDNTAIQDGFQLYLHSFIVSNEGEWAVVQQGMNDVTGMARRYHWHSLQFHSYINEPHTSIYGVHQGNILNLTDSQAAPARNHILQLIQQESGLILNEFRNLIMPSHHDVRAENVNLKRLGATLALAHEMQPKDFESLLLLQGVGPRTLQSLALVSEVVHGTPVRFDDPARFSFAHGGKDGHPFPVPLQVYDETIELLRTSVEKAKIGHTEKKEAIKNLSLVAQEIEKDFVPNSNFGELVKKERNESYKYNGRTVSGKAKPPVKTPQLRLFE